jgi:hypothetical protein
MALVELKKLYVAKDYLRQVQKQLTSDSVCQCHSRNSEQWSFFTQRCIVYHNALYAASPQYRMDGHGTILLNDKGAPKFVEEDFKRIDVTIPAAPFETSESEQAPPEQAPPPIARGRERGRAGGRAGQRADARGRAGGRAGRDGAGSRTGWYGAGRVDARGEAGRPYADVRREGREDHLVSPQFGINAGVIDQHYKTITSVFLSENAPVEDSGQTPHRAIKI